MSKVEKIRKEIERLKAETFENKELSLEEIIAVRNCCNNLLFFIDPLEQPIKRTPAEIEAALQEVEEKSKAFTAAHPNGFDISFGEADSELSNDLEEAATKYARKQLSNPDYPTYNDEYEMECAFEAGAQWQKEQMMKDAVEAVVHPYDGEIWVNKDLLSIYDDCQRVKLIIEEE